MVAGRGSPSSPPAAPTPGDPPMPCRPVGPPPPGLPTALSVCCGPMPDSISRCADPIAPADRTIRSAVRSTAPSGPLHSTPTARPPTISIRPDPGIGQHCEVRAIHRRFQVGPARADPRAAVDVQRHRTDARRQWRVRRRSVEVLDPPIARLHRGIHESGCTTVEFGDTLNHIGPSSTVQRTLEVEIGLDRQEVRKHVGPRPSRHPPPVEVRRQPAAEVAAVDRTGSADHRTPHDLCVPFGVIGQRRRIAPHHRAGGADRQPQAVADLASAPEDRTARGRPRRP